MKTIETEDFRRAIHLAKLMPQGKHSPEKKDAVRKWNIAIKKALAHNSN